jgi:thioredoxin reductase (NADPH)
MFTRDEVRTVQIFSGLADTELDHLASTSADLHLLPGEYVVHEGEMRRVLFALVEGQVEVTKFMEGTERIVGVRARGEVFGEVPIVLGSPFLVSFRATERSRVMQIDAKDFHTVSASAPEVAAAVNARALERVGGLQELAAEPSRALIEIVGPQFDNATHELREFLQRNSVQFDWTVPENATPGDRYPLVRLRDGKELVTPSIREVAVAIGLCVFPKDEVYDVAIVGAGPAGLAAAVYGASEGLSTVLIEQEAPGGQAGTSSRIENYLGFPFGVPGDELANRALQQASRLGAEVVVTRDVQNIDTDSRKLVFDGGDTVHAKTIVLAMGVSWRRLGISSLDRLQGRGVYYGASPAEVRAVQGKDIYLIGGGNSAGQAAINFANFANSVTLLVRGDSLEKSMSQYLIEQLRTKSNVRVETDCEVIEAFGDEHLETIAVRHKTTGETSEKPASALFILIGADAQTAWLPGRIERDARDFVVTGPDILKSGQWGIDRDPYLLETSVPGIFAVGDVRAGSIKRVAAAVGEGSTAIAFVHQYLAYAGTSLQVGGR